ncbi:Hint domain-containing protein [Pseudorhodobacter sp. W20_MBD10_FR17]|uniref:Hint domain-containing protein n=1 Tax=Pseudorhodobacter sp. W20_MBD10_FR17 TaxID=3240266 RepID=UPI003F98C0BF
MTDWLALSDHGAALGTPSDGALLTKGTLVFECTLPLADSTVLLNFKADDNWPRAMALFADDVTGLALLHRQGDRLVRHVLPGPLNFPSEGILRLIFSWDGPEKIWTLAAEMPEDRASICAQGRDPMPMLFEDLLQICRGGAGILRHSALQWFGVTEGQNLPGRAQWVGLHTQIDTVDGPVAAGRLEPGDMLLTEAGDFAPVLSVQRMVLPSRGSFSPVLLRAPYFGAHSDILVSSDQLIAVSGDEVEYLFGDETVLTQACHLTDGRAALMDLRRTVTSCVALDIGTPQLLRAEGCRLLSHSNGPSWQSLSKPYGVIQGFEAKPLLEMLGRMGVSYAA